MNKKATTLIERFGFKDTELTTPEHDEMLLWLLKPENYCLIVKLFPIVKTFKEIRIVAESPVLGYNSFNVGFVDAEIVLNNVECSFFGMTTYPSEVRIRIEIKPTIKSIGELLRQIQLYRTHELSNTYYVVITKTQNLKDILGNQGIRVWEYSSVLGEKTTQQP